MVTVNQKYGNLLTTTLANYGNTLTEQVFTGMVLTYMLNQKGKVTEAGGEAILEPVLVGKNTTIKAHGDTEVLSAATTINTAVTDADGADLTKATTKPPFGDTNQGRMTNLRFEWRQFSGMLAYNAMEVDKNASKFRLMGLVKTRMDILEESIKDELERMLMGKRGAVVSGSWTAFANGAALSGIGEVLTKLTGQSTAGTNDSGELHRYGDIPYSATAGATDWLQPYVLTGASGTKLNIDDIEVIVTSLDRGATDSSDIAVAAPKQWRELSKGSRGAQRWVNTEMLEAGFKNIHVDGLPFMYLANEFCSGTPSEDQPWDEDHVAVLNSKYISVVRHKVSWLVQYEWEKVQRAPVWESQVRSVGQLTCKSRKRQALMDYSAA